MVKRHAAVAEVFMHFEHAVVELVSESALGLNMKEHEECIFKALDFHRVLDLTHDELHDLEEEGALKVQWDKVIYSHV